jgi:hypothetical protein
MRIIGLICLLLLTLTAFASESVSTRFGKLAIKPIGDDNVGLFLDSKVLFKRESGFLTIEQVFHVGDSEAALIRDSEGGSGTTDEYFFVKLAPASPPVLSQRFEAVDRELIHPVQKGASIYIDLRYNEGVREQLTYQNGQISISKARPKGKVKAGNEDDCKYLYESLYVAYVQARECKDGPDEAGGMAGVRAYNAIANDPHFNLKAFDALSKASCTKVESIRYSDFKKKVCGG